jgi:hypothetical protein
MTEFPWIVEKANIIDALTRAASASGAPIGTSIQLTLPEGAGAVSGHTRVAGPSRVSGSASVEYVALEPKQPYSLGSDEALRRALLHILGDMPSPMEDAWERCREIAAAALGYAKPGPLKRDLPPVWYETGGSFGWNNQVQLPGTNAGTPGAPAVWAPVSGCTCPRCLAGLLTAESDGRDAVQAAYHKVRGERDRALEMMARLIDAEAFLKAAVDKLTDDNAALGATNERLRDEISALTVVKNALQDVVVSMRESVGPHPEKPFPFREFPGDRRRMGP